MRTMDARQLILRPLILFESLAAFDFIEFTNRPILRGLGCAALTLQLAVDNALKQSCLKSGPPPV